MDKQRLIITKASDIKKESVTKEWIYKEIAARLQHNPGIYKYLIYSDLYLSEEVIMSMIQDGFKVYKGDFDSVIKNVWIVEW